jgi:hypothetical protein
MRRYRMVDMCKGKRKLWLQGTDDVLVVGLHMVGKRVKVSSLNNVTSFLTLYFLFFHLIHPSHIFIATSSFSFSFSSFILSFSYFFSLFFSLLTTFQSSQPLSFSHAYNLKFQINHARHKKKPLKVGCVQGMRCTKEMYRVGYGIRRCTRLPRWKSHDRMYDEASNKR